MADLHEKFIEQHREAALRFIGASMELSKFLRKYREFLVGEGVKIDRVEALSRYLSKEAKRSWDEAKDMEENGGDLIIEIRLNE